MKYRQKSQSNPSAADGKLPTICIVGDAQARGLVLAFGKVPALASAYDIVYDGDGSKIADADLNRCAFFLQQGDATSKAPRLPRTARRINYPKLRFDLLWPLACPNPYNKPEPGNPIGPYPLGNSFILSGIEQGVSADDLLRLLLAPAWNTMWPNLDALFTKQTSAMLAADEKADVKIGSFILKNFRKRRLFWAPTAPSNELLTELAYRVLHGCFGRENTVDREAIGSVLSGTSRHDVMAHVAVPVHPLIASHFALEWFNKEEQYPYFDTTRSFESYFKGMIDYVCASRAKGDRNSAVPVRA